MTIITAKEEFAASPAATPYSCAIPADVMPRTP